jgi:hypothetical protein
MGRSQGGSPVFNQATFSRLGRSPLASGVNALQKRVHSVHAKGGNVVPFQPLFYVLELQAQTFGRCSPRIRKAVFSGLSWSADSRASSSRR